jgi:hypothetical protein
MEVNKAHPSVVKLASDRALHAIESCARFLYHPFNAYQQNPPALLIEGRVMHLLFGLNFLIKEGHVNRQGLPCDLAGLIARLHFVSPQNFVCAEFLTGENAILPGG